MLQHSNGKDSSSRGGGDCSNGGKGGDSLKPPDATEIDVLVTLPSLEAGPLPAKRALAAKGEEEEGEGARLASGQPGAGLPPLVQPALSVTTTAAAAASKPPPSYSSLPLTHSTRHNATTDSPL